MRWEPWEVVVSGLEFHKEDVSELVRLSDNGRMDEEDCRIGFEDTRAGMSRRRELAPTRGDETV